MTYVPRMISLTPQDAAWLAQKDINLSKFLRRAIDTCRESDSRDVADIVARLRLVNSKLNELLAAYQMDATVVKERVV